MKKIGRKVPVTTCKQINVVVCLGFFALVAISCTTSQVFGSGLSSGPAQVPPPMDEITTSLPVETGTPLPSSTPIIPTPTFTATTYASLIPEGWKQFTYEKVELWMPADFVKKSSKDALVYAENKNQSGNGFGVIVELTKDTPTVPDLDDYIRNGLMTFTSETTFLEKKSFEIGSFEAKRVKVQVFSMNVLMGGAIYFIKDGGNIWIISGVSRYDRFGTWIKTFDQIARTFRINP